MGCKLAFVTVDEHRACETLVTWCKNVASGMYFNLREESTVTLYTSLWSSTAGTWPGYLLLLLVVIVFGVTKALLRVAVTAATQQGHEQWQLWWEQAQEWWTHYKKAEDHHIHAYLHTLYSLLSSALSALPLALRQ